MYARACVRASVRVWERMRHVVGMPCEYASVYGRGAGEAAPHGRIHYRPAESWRRAAGEATACMFFFVVAHRQRRNWFAPSVLPDLTVF